MSMYRNRNDQEVRRQDLTKAAILGVLVVALIIAYYLTNERDTSAVAGVDATPVPTLSASELGTGGLALTSPQPGSQVPPGASVLTGRGEPGTTIQVLVDGQPAGQATVDENGDWSLPVALEDGAALITLQSLNPDGSVAAEAGPFGLSVGSGAEETTPPPVGEGAPPDEVTVEPLPAEMAAGEVTVSGTGVPGAQVVVLVDQAPAGTATVGVDGTWSLPVELAEGQHVIQARTLDNLGAVLAQTPAATVQVLPGAVPETGERVTGPTFDPLSGEYALSGVTAPGTTVTIIVGGAPHGTATADATGRWTYALPAGDATGDVQVQETDAAGTTIFETEPVTPGVAPPTIDLPGLATIDPATAQARVSVPAGQFTWRGRGEPGTTVEAVADGQSVGTAVVDPDGNWTLTATLPAGEYVVELNTLDPSGNRLSTSGPIAVTALPMIQPQIEAPAGALAAGPTTLSGRAEPGKTVVIVVNDQAVASVVAGKDGLWNVAVTVPAGATEVQAQTLGEDGAFVMGSAPLQLSVPETQPPPLAEGIRAPVIDESGVPTFRGYQLTVTGTAEPGKSILVRLNGAEYGAAVLVDPSGFWAVPGTVAAGDYEIVADMLDANGALLAVSPPVRLQVQ